MEVVAAMRVVSRVPVAHIVDLSGDWWRAVAAVEFCCLSCGCWGLLVDAASMPSSSSSSSEKSVGVGSEMLRSIVGGVSGSMNVV